MGWMIAAGVLFVGLMAGRAVHKWMNAPVECSICDGRCRAGERLRCIDDYDHSMINYPPDVF